jgi:hypothetical protein
MTRSAARLGDRLRLLSGRASLMAAVDGGATVRHGAVAESEPLHGRPAPPQIRHATPPWGGRTSPTPSLTPRQGSRCAGMHRAGFPRRTP